MVDAFAKKTEQHSDRRHKTPVPNFPVYKKYHKFPSCLSPVVHAGPLDRRTGLPALFSTL
jgi:hypothetical protein